MSGASWQRFESAGKMLDNDETMSSSSLSSYRCPLIHEAVSAIIRQRSTNPQDIREVALDGLDLSSAQRILDLGCGFGFMAEVLAERVDPEATIVGVDAWASNEGLFVKKVTDAGREADFVCTKVDSRLPWPDGQFDVVVCCYALYFFVDVLPEIARVLSPNGVFVTITHTEGSVAGQLPAAGFAEAAEALLKLTRRFSAENGLQLLSSHFGEIEQIDYSNSLRFRPEDADDLFAYLRFKLPLLTPGSEPDDALPDHLTRFVHTALSHLGEVVVEKDDAVFQCRKPLWR